MEIKKPDEKLSVCAFRMSVQIFVSDDSNLVYKSGERGVVFEWTQDEGWKWTARVKSERRLQLSLLLGKLKIDMLTCRE